MSDNSNDDLRLAVIEEQADAAIRREWASDRWFFSVIDVVGFLTESKSPRHYCATLKRRLQEEGYAEVLTNCQHLKLHATDGKRYATDAADLETMLRIIQAIPSPKPEPIKQWLAKVGARELEEVARPVPAYPHAARPLRPAPEAPALEWAEYHEAMATLYRRQIAVETTLSEHDAQIGELFSRVEGIEEVTSHLLPELLERLGPQTLSIDHQSTVQQAAKRLSELTGTHYNAIYAELNLHFHVPRYTEIPELRWEDVVEWFRVRIHAAERRQHGGRA